MSTLSARDPWLDLLRAAAILLVLLHHVGQEWPVVRPWLYPYTSMGAKGVDLFFVLSGWLIGGLFW
jgi:peptidoglycan/LPS O-acetylase OafA/YrhL